MVKKLLPAGEALASIDKLFGEASYREYFRVRSSPTPSYILMKMPPGKQSVSEEITNYRGPKEELPFLNIARYLESQKLPTPHVLATDLPQGLVLLQDLGDQSLESMVKNSNPEMLLFFYKQALELLVRFQKTGREHPDSGCMAFHRGFDENLLLWEFEHFLEFGIEDRFQIKIPSKEREEILKNGQELVKSIGEIPYGLTHRDFQSRNLFLFGYEFYMIDFQDALQGPPQYDLVALLRDSYVSLPESTLKKLIQSFLNLRNKAGFIEDVPTDFIKNFHRVTLQRKLKDAGRFQFIHTVKKNSKFLPYVSTSLKYVKHAFGELPEYRGLHQQLASYVPELAPS